MERDNHGEGDGQGEATNSKKSIVVRETGSHEIPTENPPTEEDSLKAGDGYSEAVHNGKIMVRETDPVSPSTEQKPKSVRFFQDLEIREYKVTLGDNPSVQTGTPIALDWEPSNVYKLDLEAYEAAVEAEAIAAGSGGGKRSVMEMRVPANVREKWLKQNHTHKEIMLARREVSTVRSQRKFTAASLEMESFEVAWQSAGRKIKRWWTAVTRKSDEKARVDPAVAWLEEYKKTAKPFPNRKPAANRRVPPVRRSTFAGEKNLEREKAAPKALEKRSISDDALASKHSGRLQQAESAAEQNT